MDSGYPFEVRIETKQEDDGWWGIVYLFGDFKEPPLLVGPCADEDEALRRARTLARDIVGTR
jgi:hypothetical protein